MADDYPEIKLDGQFPDIMEKFCHLGDTIGTRGVQLTVLQQRLRVDGDNLQRFSSFVS